MCVSISESPDFITLAEYPQAIIHVDCDAFFASCEQARYPYLKGKVVVTGQERGIVSCPSYEAKAVGIQRGMRLGEVKRIYPGVYILPSDYELYSIYSHRLFEILRRFTPQVEEYSIDEAFCDVTGLRRIYRCSYEKIASQIKQQVQKEIGITVSVGLSLSKSLAKICSKHKKPDGFMALPGNRLHLFLPTISLERVCGFGPNTVELLRKHGVNTIGEYINRPLAFARKYLGKGGHELWLELRGVKVYEVKTQSKQRYLTISKTKTFMPVSCDRNFVKAQLIRNLESALIKLRRHRLSCRCLTIYLKKRDFSASGCEGRINRYSASALDWAPVGTRLFDDVFEERVFYRATGVILSQIVSDQGDRGDLFDVPARIEQARRVSHAMDVVNASYGKHTIHLACAHDVSRKSPHARHEVTWRKTELLKGETSRRRLNIPLLRLS